MDISTLRRRHPASESVLGIDEAELVAAYEAANAGDWTPMRELMVDDSPEPDGRRYLHRIPSLDLEVRGADAAVDVLARLYDERQVAQAPVRWHQHGELVVLDIEGTSLYRGRFTAVHVCLVRDGRLAETTVVAPPLPVPAPRPVWLPGPAR